MPLIIFLMFFISWATPAQQLKVQRFKPGGTALESEYQLNVYERNVQVILI